MVERLAVPLKRHSGILICVCQIKEHMQIVLNI